MIRTYDTRACGRGSVVGRRAFLRTAALGTAALALPSSLIADPYAPLAPRHPARPVRIRGLVRRRGGGGIGGVDHAELVMDLGVLGFEFEAALEAALGLGVAA